MPHPLKSKKGFTLLELIISMAIIGVLAAIIFNGVRLGLRAREMGEDLEENNQRLRAIYTMISSKIQSAQLYYYPAYEEEEDEEAPVQTGKTNVKGPRNNKLDLQGEKKLAFVGKPQSIQFITSAARLIPGKHPGGLHETSIFLDEDSGLLDSAGLLLKESPIRYPDIFQGEEEPVTLAEDVSDLLFRYYFIWVEGGNITGEWFESFDDAFFEQLKESMETEDEAGGALPDFMNYTYLPIAVEVSFTISIPKKRNGKDFIHEVKFPPTVIFIKSGLDGVPILNPDEETDGLAYEDKN